MSCGSRTRMGVLAVASGTSIRYPVLSPDGRQVAFVRPCASGCGGVSLVDVYTGAERVLLREPQAGTQWSRPVFSPDGRRLLLTRRVIGTYPPYVDEFSIYRINVDGGDLAELVAWRDPYGRPDQANATFSPDGTKIAFSSGVTPDGARQRGRTLWMTNADGTSPRQLTTVPDAAYREGGGDIHNFGDYPSFSPAGDQLAFTYDTLENPEPYSHYDVDLYRVNIDGSGLQPLTTSPDTDEGGPAWSSAGRIAFSAANHNSDPPDPWAIHTIAPDGSGSAKLIGDSYYGYSFPSFGPWVPATDAQLLTLYGPTLRYDAQENYRADSVATITDNCVLDSRGRVVRSNYLKNTSGRTLAASCGGRYPTLSLSYLGSYSVQATDFIDQANNYQEDAQRLHAANGYGNKAYGRVVSSGDGGKVLQYWLFYYYNPKEYPPLVGVGEHESDWEMMQVEIDGDQRPVRAAYSQHGGGERCDWANVQRTDAGRPIVYVAEGSHANYFSSGYHLNEGANDTANGDGEVATPTVVDLSPAPAWLPWPGRWGGSGSSPPGPVRQTTKWNGPVSWSNGIDGCTESQSQAVTAKSQTEDSGDSVLARQLRPPMPTVKARRRGKNVLIRYSFTNLPKDKRQRPGQIVSSVDPSGGRYPPLTVRTPVSRASGTIVQPLGLGKAPFRVLVRAVGRAGVRSKKVSVPLR